LNKKIALWITGVTILMALTVWAGWQELIEALAKTDPLLLTLLFIVQLITLLLLTYQWEYIIRKTGDLIGYWKTFIILQAGYFVEMVTPSSKLGGEAAKIYLFRHNTQMNYTGVTAAMLAQKYISLVPFLLIATVFTLTGYIYYGVPGVSIIALLFLASIVIVLLGLAAWSRKTNREIGVAEGLTGKVLSGIRFIKNASEESSRILNKKDITYLFSLSGLIWILYPFKVWIVIYMLGYDIGLVFIVVVTYVSYLVSILPVTPGGIGTFEGTMALLFSLNGYTFAEGLAVALITRLATYWFPLLISFTASIYLSKSTEIPLLHKKQ